jgi:hypothetical protein
MSDVIRSTGGIIVPIEGDLSKLKEKLGEVKRIAANPDLVKITPQMSFDERQVSVQVNKIIRKMQSDAAKQTAQIQLFGETPQPVKLKPRFTVDQQVLRDGMARAKREIRAAAQSALQEEATIKVRAELVGLAGSHNGGIEGRDFLKPRNVAKAATRRNPGLLEAALGFHPSAMGPLGTIIAASAISKLAASGINGGVDVYDLASSNRIEVREQAKQNIRNMAIATPLAGPLAGALARAYDRMGVPHLFGNMTEEDERLAADDQARMEREMAGRGQRAQAAQQLRASRAGLAAQAASLAGNDALAAQISGKQLIHETSLELDPEVQRVVALRIQQAASAHAEGIAQLYDPGRQSAFGAAIVGATLSGNGRAAFGLTLASQQSAQQATARGRVASARNQEEFNAANIVNNQQAAELNAKQALAIDDEKKRRAVDTESAIAAASDATLRTQHRGYEADLKAFDANAKAKLSIIRDLEAKQNEATRLTAQRQILVFDQTQQIMQVKLSLAAAATVATLSANHQNQAAARAAFDAETQKEVAAADAATRPNVIASRQEQREALLKQQAFDRQTISNSLRTRRFEARAQGNGEDQLASVIGQVAAQREEVRSATDATDRGELLRTQYTELKAERRGLMRPRGYLQAVDPLSELPGGPGGDEGKQMVDILKLIDQRMQQLVQQGGGAVLQ